MPNCVLFCSKDNSSHLMITGISKCQKKDYLFTEYLKKKKILSVEKGKNKSTTSDTFKRGSTTTEGPWSRYTWHLYAGVHKNKPDGNHISRERDSFTFHKS
jgi:hypothetical protein